MWIKQAYRDYYKPKLRRELEKGPRARENWTSVLKKYIAKSIAFFLQGFLKGLPFTFMRSQNLPKKKLDGFRDGPEEYLFERFGGGNYKLNFYEGPSFVVCVNFKPKGEPKWIPLLPEKAGSNPKPA